ncbi:MAG TPA: hypothetical protein VG944_23785, partial [Fimbriimonas sp.]|nr:hypothetical protein [Fimbriimonas sp.]
WLRRILSALGGSSQHGQESDARSIELGPGYLCAFPSEEGGYRIAKILALDDRAVHICLYSNNFAEVPTHIDPDTLTLGIIHDPDDPGEIGIGHLPISVRSFKLWQPKLIQIEPVEEEELEGFRIWQEAGGGVFD